MELIKIYQGNLIDAKELHTFLEIKTKYGDWLNRSIISDFIENKDFFSKLRKSTGGRPKRDHYLTIDAAKKLAMMAKTHKGAEARDYFLECEKIIIELRQNKRLEAFLKLEATKERLQQNVLNLGGKHIDYIQIDTAGRKVFFNNDLVPDEQLSLLALKARDFATELTNDDLANNKHSLDDIEAINIENHKKVREVITIRSNRKPEDLPIEDDIKKLE